MTLTHLERLSAHLNSKYKVIYSNTFAFDWLVLYQMDPKNSTLKLVVRFIRILLTNVR